MAEPRRVLIENKAGESYSVTPADFRSIYEEQGFKIVRWEDGEDYDEPKAASKKE